MSKVNLAARVNKIQSNVSLRYEIASSRRSKSHNSQSAEQKSINEEDSFDQRQDCESNENSDEDIIMEVNDKKVFSVQVKLWIYHTKPKEMYQLW